MFNSKTFAVALTLLAVAAAGCSKQSDAERNKQAAAIAASIGKALDKATAPKKAASSKNLNRTAAAFYSEYMAVRGMQAMRYMNAKIALDGTVRQVLDMGGAGYQIWLAAPDKGRVVIKFKDNGAHAKTKKLKRGDSVKLSGCSVSGKTTRAVHMSDCRLAS